MGIRQRVLDAELLWNSNQREGAWIQAMIATAASARKRYPKPISDSESFKRYIRDIGWTIFTGNPKPPNLQTGHVLFKFGERSFEDILYKDYRCSWIHEAALDNAGLSESKVKGNAIIETLVVGANTQLPDHWVLNILNAIRWSPENANEFDEK
ncbi:hypothetical protein SKTS_13970 [Sulfurimicrobium lacus]|uniref:Uncharacterized protein n=1 Tax=Sulfurimicrobium lacus TaxID=2715678 RepID=A0A6F8VBJ0_9PROT|nr:hypothetical protein [Sulfurimicrobium lacus]BCB26511.1 hypothetical protein SKTS_13970 [Sulfurimicrobium lacus]